MNRLSSQTIALDPVTMTKALTRLAAEIDNGCTWEAMSDDTQEHFLSWYRQHKQAVEGLKNLKTAAGNNAAVLNKFLVDNGFKPMFREISRGGYGAAAILDMLVEWEQEASLTRFFAHENSEEIVYDAFELPSSGIQIFDVSGQSDKLVKIATKDGSAVWLMMANQPEHGLDLLDLAMNAMASKKPADSNASAIVPMIDISTEVPLDWMLGVNCGSQYIEQAFQQFRVRMNEKRARAKVATGFATRECVMIEEEPITFDRPFAGWFTQDGSELPMALFYAAHDSWKTAGSLNDM